MTNQEILDSIAAKEKEKAKLFDELRVWFEAEAQGINIENVSSFGFDPAFVPQQETVNKSNPYGWETMEVNGRLIATPKIFNYVRTKTGEKIQLAKPIVSVNKGVKDA